MTIDSKYGRQAYIWISVALAIPVLFWPTMLPMASPRTYEIMAENWLLSAAAMLLAVVVADAVLNGAATLRRTVLAAVWILLVSVLVPMVGHAPWAGWLIASLFALHALQPAVAIWQARVQWWHWFAWGRDNVTALAIFYWLMNWPV